MTVRRSGIHRQSTQWPENPVIRLHSTDDVVIARRQLVEGMLIADQVIVRGLIPPGHKVSTGLINQGEPAKRYGQIIGFATQTISHTQNLAMGSFKREYTFAADAKFVPAAEKRAGFMGITRSDGRVATRNYIGVLTTVKCSATVAHAIADHFRKDIHPEELAAFPNVDGVVALTHGLGCSIDADGEGLAVIRRTLGGYARHANFAAVLVVGLGCETNQIEGLMNNQGLSASFTLRSMSIQATGGTAKSVTAGIDQIKQMLPAANSVIRGFVDASSLIVGLQCGGSDGYSGISANPALGAAGDLRISHGGTAILSETPELYGAED